MTKPQLLPKAPKRKRQPTAACMREQLAMAADQIIALKIRLSAHTDPDSAYRITTLRDGPFMLDNTWKAQPWWRRIFRKS